MYNFLAKLLNFIESSTDHTSSDIIIAEYILRNVRELSTMSIYDVAEACHTSPATITRFCKRFENISFKELKEHARSFVEFNVSEVLFQQMEQNIDDDFLDDYYKELQESLAETSQLIRPKELLQIARRIHEAKKISFFGVTFSHVIARNAQFKFMRLGKYSAAYSNHENQLTEAHSLTCADIAIVISFSGKTRFIVQLVKTLKERGIPIIAITGDTQSFLAQNSNDLIPVSNRKLEYYKSPLIEEISMLSVINSIYLMYSVFLNGLEHPQ
jgi:DNA-binding MurR/RpiR family transcriptional regulator